MVSESGPLEPGGTLRLQSVASLAYEKKTREEREGKGGNEMAANPTVTLSLRCFASFAVWKL